MSSDFENVAQVVEETRVQGSGVRVQGNGADAAPSQSKIQNLKSKITPPWQAVSGLTPDVEPTLSPAERRACLRKLLKFVEKEIREELAQAAADPAKEERTFLWDPVLAICTRLGISRTKLSRLSKEFSGMSASDLVDKIRAEKVLHKMRADLAALLRVHRPPGGDWLIKVREGDYWGLWKIVKICRREPEFNRTAWALSHGFANYTRFYRGCLLCHGQAPHQLELSILKDFDEFYNVVSALEIRRHLKEYHSDGDVACENAAKNDAWTKAAKERPEWLARLRGELGLAAHLCNFANG